MPLSLGAPPGLGRVESKGANFFGALLAAAMMFLYEEENLTRLEGFDLRQISNIWDLTG